MTKADVKRRMTHFVDWDDVHRKFRITCQVEIVKGVTMNFSDLLPDKISEPDIEKARVAAAAALENAFDAII